jgi:hypothetical protein
VSVCNPRIGSGAIRRHDAGVTGGVGVADGEGVTEGDTECVVAPGGSGVWAQPANESIVTSATAPSTIQNVPTRLELVDRIATAPFVGPSEAWLSRPTAEGGRSARLPGAERATRRCRRSTCSSIFIRFILGADPVVPPS